MKKSKKTTILIVISVLVSLLSVFLKGPILINHQELLPMMNTYSGGFPVSWFELYYPISAILSFEYIYNNFNGHYKIDLLAFSINMVIIFMILRLLKKLILKSISFLNK